MSNNPEKNRKHKIKSKLAAIAALAFCVLFVWFSPSLIKDGLMNDVYREWLEYKEEPAVGMIKIWHVVGFKPYVGSLGNWLQKRTDEFKKRFIGVYFEVSSYSVEDAKEQLARGNLPDLISFGNDVFDMDTFLELTEDNAEGEFGVYAVPYCASGYFTIWDPSKTTGMSMDRIVQSAADDASFKKGKAASCICDIRGLGDIARAQLVGKCSYFEAEPYPEGGFLIQYLGIRNGADPAKIPYLKELIAYLSSEKAQSTLCGIGLLPVCAEAKRVYEQELIKKLDELFDRSILPPAFD